MKTMKKRLLSCALALAMVIAMLPMMAFAADPVSFVSRVWDADQKKVVEKTEQATTYKVVDSNTTAFADGGWYVVSGDVTVEERIKVTNSANLILADGAKLTASKGINLAEGNTLNIYGQANDTGKLIATGVDEAAGIGGDYRCTGGTITICGGEVTANGGNKGAGIGGGYFKDGGTVTINGGEVTAAGGNFGAGIGGGWCGAGGSITINGGDVTATGGNKGAGIGGGISGDGGTITINGGEVMANGGNNGAGIGGGCWNLLYNGGAGGSVTITGGTVTATGNGGGAGIGGGNDGKAATVTLGNGVAVKYGTTSACEGGALTSASTTTGATLNGKQYAKVEAAVFVTGVALDMATASMTVGGDTLTLAATVAPENATNQNVSWESNNTDVATVEDGVVTAVAAGEATITVTTEDGNKTAFCVVTVEAALAPAPDYVSTIAMKNDAAIETDLSVTLPANTYYTEDMGTEADKAGGYVTTYVDDSNAGMDIDLYVWEKDKSIKEEALAEAEANPVTYEIINGVHTAYYFDNETEDGVDYKTLTYLFDDGNYIAELVFWFDLVAEKTDAEMNQAALEGAAGIIASLTAAHAYQDNVCTKCGDTITYAASEQTLGDNMTVTIGENAFIWDDFAANNAEDYLGIFRQPDADALDVDYYQWDKVDKTLSEEAKAEMDEANEGLAEGAEVAHDLTITTIKGIAVATYLNNNDEGSKSITAIFDGGDYFAELVFFYADDDEKAQAEEIINSVVGIFGVTYQKKTSRFDYGTPVTVSAGNDTSAKYNWYDVTTGERKLVATGNKYYFAVTKDVKVESEKVEEVKPVLNLTIGDRFATNPGANDGKETVVLTAQWAVPEGYTFKEGGIKRAYSTKAEGPISNLNALTTTNTSSLKTPNGTYNYTIKMAATAAVKNINAVAYLIYVDANGVDQYMTTDIMVSAPTK